MKISVIVTTYNRPDALKKVLDGLLSQTRLPHEIIIADDGSTNDTREMLQPFLASPAPLIKHVWQEDNGFRAARIRNLAIKASNGEYLVLLDGDCIPDKYFISDHRTLAQKGSFFQGKRVIVSQGASDSFFFSDTQSLYRRIKHSLTGSLSNRHHIIRIPFFPSVKVSKLSGVRSCNMGIFKTDLLAVNGFNEAFKGWGREDSELVVRLYRYGLNRKENPFQAICYHLWHEENTRTSIEKNDQLLEQAMSSGNYYCKAGIEQNE